MIRCPLCNSSGNIEQELPVGADGRLDVFAPDSTVYLCRRDSTRRGAGLGCGHRWDEAQRRIEAACAAVRLIPVTESTQSHRAAALLSLESLQEDITITARKSA